MNKNFVENVRKWGKICERLYVWDYMTNFSHFILPYPNLKILGPNIKFMAANNVKGVFSQGAYSSFGAEMAELRAWVTAKLLWNAALDADALIAEFITGYYGAAGPEITAYLEMLDDSLQATGEKLGIYEPVDPNYLTFDVLYKGWGHMEKAAEAVKDNAELAGHVEVAQLPLTYVFLMRWDEMRKAADTAGVQWTLGDSAQKKLDWFMKIVDKNGIKRQSETVPGFGPLKEAVAKIKD